MARNENLTGKDYDVAVYEGPLLRVIAGPGTGKTTALKRRVARLLDTGVQPERILVVTFTRTAADDLRKELNKLAVPGVEKLDTGTLHSFCFRTLQRARVFDRTRRVARPLLDFEERFLLEDVNNQDVFGNVYQRIKRLNALSAAWARLYDQEIDEADDVDLLFESQVVEWLKFHDAIHLDELVPITVKYLRNNPSASERNLYEHILVDEYQDLNRAEQSLVDLLAGNGTLTVVGDEDQSIYEDLRYAHPEGISQFHQSHSDTYDVSLGKCWRCPQRIVTMANSLIRHNVQRDNRILNINPEQIAGKVVVVQWKNMEAEAEGIAKYIGAKIEAGEFKPGEVLVLSPNRQIGYGIRDALRERGRDAYSFFTEQILEGLPKDLERCKAQEAFVLLTLLAQPGDKVAFRCWLGFGSPSLRQAAYKRLQEHCSVTGLSPRQALEKICEGELSISYVSGLVERYRLLQERLTVLVDKTGREVFDELFPDGEEWSLPFRSLAEVEDFVEEWTTENVWQALHTSIIQPELPDEVSYVRVMSLHKSKGLGANHVIVVGCVEGLIPRHPREDYPFNQQQRYTEEQRRLFYVAITRAKKTLILSSVAELQAQFAHRNRIPVMDGNRYVASVMTSTFFGELGPAAPPAILGEEWKY